MNFDLSAVVAVAALILSIYLGLKKMPHETRVLDGGYVTAIEEAANRISKRNLELMTRIDELEKRVEELERQVAEGHKYKNWAERLVLQIKSWNEIPVPLDATQPRPKAKNE
jgi:hypothetical protein